MACLLNGVGLLMVRALSDLSGSAPPAIARRRRAAAGVRIARRWLWLSGLVDNDPGLFVSGLKQLSIARGKLGPGRKRNAPQDFPESGFANRKECFLRCESGIGILQRIEDNHEF